MSRRLLALLALVPTGCGEFYRGPTVAVERWDRSGCYRPCAPGPTAAPEGSTWPAGRCADIVAAEECVFVGGRDEGRVVAWFDGVLVDDPLKNLASSVELRVDTDRLETKSMNISHAGTATTPPVLTATFVAPSQQTNALSFLVRNSDSYFTNQGLYRTTAPTLGVSIRPCATSTCTIGRGTAGTLSVTVEAPANLAGDKATVTARVDGIFEQQQITADLLITSGGRLKVATLTGISIPERGSVLMLDVTVGRTSLPIAIPLTSPRLEIVLPTCQVPNCTLPSVGTLPVEIRAPRALRTPEARLTLLLDGRPYGAPISVALGQAGEGVRALHALALPDLPGRRLRLEAQAGTATAASRSEITLADPPPLDVCVSTGTLAASWPCPPITLASTEWPSCGRRATVSVRSRLDPAVGAVTITAESDAAIFDGSTSTHVRLSANGEGEVAATLPATSANDNYIQVRQGSLPAMVTRIARVPVAAEGGLLLPDVLRMRVAAAGSTPTSLSGQLVSPRGLTLPTGTRAELRVTALAAANSTSPSPCGPALPADLLDCNPPGSVRSGACLLTPNRFVTTDADGRFSVPLQGGLCFAGVVTIEVYADVYASAASVGCLGERTIERRRVALSLVELAW